MRIGIADTTFARVDMAKVALDTIDKEKGNYSELDLEVERYTVPGFKDLPVAAKLLIEKYNCDIVLAFGWAGRAEIDETCAHEANLGLIQAELMTNTHILKVFIHERESEDKNELVEVAIDRARKHTINALDLLKGKEVLSSFSGKGRRQGYSDEGGLE